MIELENKMHRKLARLSVSTGQPVTKQDYRAPKKNLNPYAQRETQAVSSYQLRGKKPIRAEFAGGLHTYWD